MSEVIIKKEEDCKFKIFGDVDRRKDGKLKSDYPSWYFPQQKEELQESIKHKKTQLDMEIVSGTDRNIMRETLAKEEKRLEEIESSTPRFTDEERDQILKIYKSMGKKIGESMFRRSEMEKGLADAHEEARRISEFCIPLDEKEISLCKCCEVPISDTGKVSRDGASKAWKIAARILGENSNTETLRRP